MHKTPNQFSEQKSSNKQLSKSQPAGTAHHVPSHTKHRPVFRTGGLGSSDSVGSLLHALPFEMLTNVAAWLDPPSLLALGLVDKYLKRYVENDHVWQTAFLAHFLDVAPEEGAIYGRMLLLRRVEHTWKREYISRYKLLQCITFSPFYRRPLTYPIRRWNRSKATTTTHIPLMLPVTSMHLLNDRQSLVCFSADFGIAVRTLPATGSCCSCHGRPCIDPLGVGKILKGRLLPFNPDPTGPLWPRPSLCSIASEGGTVKFAWGTQSGEALYTNVPRAMEVSNHRNGRSLRCNAAGQHQGSVNHVTWAMTKATEHEYFVTGGSDGSVKIWNIDQCRVHWQSVTHTSPCIVAEFDLHARIIVSVHRNGDVMLYQNVELDTGIIGIQEDMVFQVPGVDVEAQSPSPPDKLVLDTSHPNIPTVLTHFDGDSYAWRIRFILEARGVEAARFDGPIAPLTTLECDFSSTQSSIVYGGDALGHVYAWSWSATGEHHPDGHLHVPATISWDTEDGHPVSVIRSNGTVVLTGNWRGVIKAWDTLTLRRLRAFKTPQPKPTEQATWTPVSNLVLDSDMLIASVGKYVMHWKAGAVSANQPWKKPKKNASHNNVGKGWSGAFLFVYQVHRGLWVLSGQIFQRCSVRLKNPKPSSRPPLELYLVSLRVPKSRWWLCRSWACKKLRPWSMHLCSAMKRPSRQEYQHILHRRILVRIVGARRARCRSLLPHQVLRYVLVRPRMPLARSKSHGWNLCPSVRYPARPGLSRERRVPRSFQVSVRVPHLVL
jgi:WD40 repeat protein